MFAGGKPQGPILVGGLVGDAVLANNKTKTLQAGFAYSTLGGLNRLRRDATGSDWLSSVSSQWIVSLDRGITEPACLSALLSLPTAEVRVHLSQPTISVRSLFRAPHFHAKILRLREGAPPETSLLWVGSANMTDGALGLKATNYEASVRVSDPTQLAELDGEFDGWWQSAWNASEPLSKSLITRYAAAREIIVRERRIPPEMLEPPDPESVAGANAFWMDFGAGSGKPRIQIEFPQALAAFFAPPSKNGCRVDILFSGKWYRNRLLYHKHTTYNVDIWRIGLPRGGDYPGKRIHLERKASGGNNPGFELKVAAKDSKESLQWFRTANRRGYVGATRGTSQSRPSRDFGFY